MTDHILQAIKDYVQAPRTDYALLIEGPWGCGKTYFWKNRVEPALKELCRDDGKAWKPRYVSLYGCRSTKDVDNQVLIACYPSLRKKWGEMLKSGGGGVIGDLIARFTPFKLPPIDLRWFHRFRNAVLCFDDLERTSMPLKEVMGYINTFIEHKGVKVVVLCNESGIADNGEADTYRKMKEKMVGVSLHFQSALEDVLKNLVKEYKGSSEFSESIASHAGLIHRLFARSKTSNIRSLRRAMAAAEAVFHALLENRIDARKCARQIIFAVFPTCFELQSGAEQSTPDNLRELHTKKHLLAARIGSRNKDASTLDYGEFFARKYLAEDDWTEVGDAVGAPPVCEFLISGILHREHLIAWAKEQLQTPDPDEERIKQLTLDPRSMEDEEFRLATQKTLHEVEQGAYTQAGRYVALHNSFQMFVTQRLVGLTQGELLEKFLRGLRSAKEAEGIEATPGGSRALTHPAFSAPTAESQQLLREAIAINDELHIAQWRVRVQHRVAELMKQPDEFIRVLVHGEAEGTLNGPFLQVLDMGNMAKWILTLSNQDKTNLHAAFHSRYLEHGPLSEVILELEALTQLCTALRDYYQKEANGAGPISMHLFLVNLLAETLDRAIEQLNAERQRQARSSPGVVPHHEEDGNGVDAPQHDNLT